MNQLRRYPAHRYDEYLSLKVPPLLWILMIFLVRHAVLVLLSFLPRTGEAMTYLRDLVEPWFLIADLPAALVLFAGIRRRPQAPDWVRSLWSRGRPLLIGSALLYLVLLAASLATSGRPLYIAINDVLILSVFLHLLIVGYLIRSPLIRDLFRDFPAQPRP